MTIANRISLTLIAGFTLLAGLGGMSGVELLSHIGAGAAVLAAAFVCFAFGWIGGGDGKLAATSALWLGFTHLFDYLIIASILGGGLTFLILQFRALPLPRILAAQDWLDRLHQPDGGVPYGIALAAAALIVYPQTEWMTLPAL
jgi:prepilin peptidase CpaA